VYWVDISNIAERMSKLRPWQRINHFPGMSNIARKNRLAQNLEKMRREFQKEYGFYPRTWVLPLELADFRAQFDSNGQSSRFYIVKPDSGCQGRGIFLTQTFDSISPLEQVVAQHYIRKPFLIDGFKFDLRLYVLVTSCKPLRVYLFRDGLVRLCTQKYFKPNSGNVAMRCMHLTNYAINRHSENFQGNETLGASDIGSKRSLRWFMDFLANEKGQRRSDILWSRMGAMVAKVILSILPTLVREYESTFSKGASRKPRQPDDLTSFENQLDHEQCSRTIEGSQCFEVLGVDVIIDHALKPWLVEVNHLPSFATDSPLDSDIKSRVIEQTMSIVRAKASDRYTYEREERSKAEARLYSNQSASNNLILAQESQASGVASFQRRIEVILRRHAPEKVNKISALLRKYTGREVKLLHLIEQKYLGQYTRLPTHAEDNTAGTSLKKELQQRCVKIEEKISPNFMGTMKQPFELSIEDKLPGTNCSETDSDVEFEDKLLVDFERIYPVPQAARVHSNHIPNYRALERYVFTQDAKRMRRMSCPLRQTRRSLMDFPATLPPLHRDPKDATEQRVPWVEPPRCSGVEEKPIPRKPLPVPGEKQLLAADRLTRGFSSRQHASTPRSLETSDHTDLKTTQDYAQRVASTVENAKKWRRRMEDLRKRQNCQQVALQPQSFVFAHTSDTLSASHLHIINSCTGLKDALTHKCRHSDR